MQGLLIVVALLALAGLVIFLLKRGGVDLLGFDRRSSKSWPWAKTTIDGGSVVILSRGRGGPVYELTVSNSYSVGGENYGGEYVEHFASEEEAQGVLKSFRSCRRRRATSRAIRPSR
jgi:hypothetical protein